MRMLSLIVAWSVILTGPPPKRDERGLSQSTENAILLVGAFIIAGLIVAGITAFVRTKLAEITP